MSNRLNLLSQPHLRHEIDGQTFIIPLRVIPLPCVQSAFFPTDTACRHTDTDLTSHVDLTSREGAAASCEAAARVPARGESGNGNARVRKQRNFHGEVFARG